MTISELVNLRQSGRFHHATYRDIGLLWEGLRIYETADNELGFLPGGCFYKDDPDLAAAETYLRDTGISVGARGNG